MKKMDYVEFQAACSELVGAILWTSEAMPKDVLETHTRRLMQRCDHEIDYILGMGRDPNILTRAIRYITHTTAFPTLKPDVEWFASMVGFLIELAVPNTGQTAESSAFLQDVQEGISEWTAANRR